MSITRQSQNNFTPREFKAVINVTTTEGHTTLTDNSNSEVYIYNDGLNNVFVNFSVGDGTVTASTGMCIPPKMALVMNMGFSLSSGLPVKNNTINYVTGSGTSSLYLTFGKGLA